MDKTEASTPKQALIVQQLQKDGVDLVIGRSSVNNAILHSKYIIIDQTIVESGSFNYSITAQDQDNFIDIVSDPDRARLFLDNWIKIYDDIIHEQH